MSLILGGSLIFIGGCWLYKNTLLYNLLKLYTYCFNNESYLSRTDIKKIGLEYLEYDFENLEVKKSDNFKNTDFSMSKLIYNNRIFISLSDNLKQLFIDHINEKDNILEHIISIPNPILSCTCNIYINNKMVKEELDITELINMFCFTNEVIYLNSKYILIMFYFINQEYSLNIDLNKIIDTDNNIEILKNVIPKSILNIKYNIVTKNIEMFEGDNLTLFIDNEKNITVNTP
tara:strand:+ start:541 stop:1236 length:696 start_codon:yes stop_codon:yes gene_type:complete